MQGKYMTVYYKTPSFSGPSQALSFTLQVPAQLFVSATGHGKPGNEGSQQ